MKTLLSTLALAFAASGAFAAAPTPSAEAAPKSAQQKKMASCNKEATGKKGDERKAFMKACLSKKA